ncbi:hypothetical protein PYW07_003288 [Mythimna separata]|uniref:Uncharacterized protein n=1 Tax=Mythimna separata TaxID=271217 RepID=A0AAD7YIX2_MYTSE|nr:hypothetical protein PYW07_003287 [Mythimna separata]KAJ8716661.1 hypothetical protein PYW07_003288 [Mythimna separata]
MKLTALFLMLMAVLALFAGAGDAAPKPDPKISLKTLKTTGKAVKKVVSVVSGAATARELYEAAKRRKQQG